MYPEEDISPASLHSPAFFQLFLLPSYEGVLSTLGFSSTISDSQALVYSHRICAAHIGQITLIAGVNPLTSGTASLQCYHRAVATTMPSRQTSFITYNANLLDILPAPLDRFPKQLSAKLRFVAITVLVACGTIVKQGGDGEEKRMQ